MIILMRGFIAGNGFRRLQFSSFCAIHLGRRRDNIMQTCPCNVHPLYTPLLYSKTVVYRGIHYFLIFALKHRLWVLVRTAAVLTCTHKAMF